MGDDFTFFLDYMNMMMVKCINVIKGFDLFVMDVGVD